MDTAINRGLPSLLNARVFEVYIILFSWKLIALAWERTEKQAAKEKRNVSLPKRYRKK